MRWMSITLSVGLLVASTAFAADEKEANELELKTERVIIFKDGYSLIIKQATGTANKEGEVFTDDVPDSAVLGSFWAVPEEGRLVSMTAGWKQTKESNEKDVPCTQPIEILLANKGKQARIELQDKSLYSGVIQEVLVTKTQNAVAPTVLEGLDLIAATGAGPNPLAKLASGRIRTVVAAVQPTEHTLTTISGSEFVLRTDDGDVLLPVAQVRSVLVKDMKTTIGKTYTTSRRTKRLSFKLEGAEKKQSLRVMYFRPGMRWIPTYRVALAEEKARKNGNAKEDKKDAEKKDEKPTQLADVSLQAELLNEAEDLHDVPVDIVVGVPNFRFRETPSPLVLEAVLRNTLAEAAPAIMGATGNTLSNAMYAQRSGEFRRDQAHANAANNGVDVQLPGELTAGGAQDLFVYKLPKISLEKGERCAVPIFTAQVPYRSIYTWNVHLTKHDNAAAPSGSGVQSPLVLSKNEVWHQIVLTNNTNLPWTTGAAMVLQGNQPLSQELLTYTPPKDEVRVPITVSVDTRGSVSEQEIGRELRALQWDGYNYARIEKELTLDLCNNKPVDIEAEITVRVGGKVTKASHDGKIILSPFEQADWVNYHGHPAVNNSSSVMWTVKLKPGEKFEPKVMYQYFTRH